MTKQEAIEILTEMRDWNDYITQSDALQMAIDELEKEPAANSKDAISRQAVMDGLEKYHEGADLHIDGLTYAYDLVLSTSLPYEEISFLVGYHSFSHFATSFKKHYGISPSVLRKQSTLL